MSYAWGFCRRPGHRNVRRRCSSSLRSFLQDGGPRKQEAESLWKWLGSSDLQTDLPTTWWRHHSVVSTWRRQHIHVYDESVTGKACWQWRVRIWWPCTEQGDKSYQTLIKSLPLLRRQLERRRLWTFAASEIREPSSAISKPQVRPQSQQNRSSFYHSRNRQKCLRSSLEFPQDHGQPSTAPTWSMPRQSGVRWWPVRQLGANQKKLYRITACRQADYS